MESVGTRHPSWKPPSPARLHSAPPDRCCQHTCDLLLLTTSCCIVWVLPVRLSSRQTCCVLTSFNYNIVMLFCTWTPSVFCRRTTLHLPTCFWLQHRGIAIVCLGGSKWIATHCNNMHSCGLWNFGSKSLTNSVKFFHHLLWLLLWRPLEFLCTKLVKPFLYRPGFVHSPCWNRKGPTYLFQCHKARDGQLSKMAFYTIALK